MKVYPCHDRCPPAKFDTNLDFEKEVMLDELIEWLYLQPHSTYYLDFPI